jgi:hypothetical protein
VSSLIRGDPGGAANVGREPGVDRAGDDVDDLLRAQRALPDEREELLAVALAPRVGIETKETSGGGRH